jgi:hypothetical protein
VPATIVARTTARPGAIQRFNHERRAMQRRLGSVDILSAQNIKSARASAHISQQSACFLINASLQRGVRIRVSVKNCFNRFTAGGKLLKQLPCVRAASHPAKAG